MSNKSLKTSVNNSYSQALYELTAENKTTEKVEFVDLLLEDGIWSEKKRNADKGLDNYSMRDARLSCA